jgi:hypothetical protein
MCLRPTDLQRLAVVTDPATRKLYEVLETPKTNTVGLVDIASDDDDPRLTSMLVEQAVERLDLIRHAPCAADVASVEEYGSADTGQAA